MQQTIPKVSGLNNNHVLLPMRNWWLCRSAHLGHVWLIWRGSVAHLWSLSRSAWGRSRMIFVGMSQFVFPKCLSHSSYRWARTHSQSGGMGSVLLKDFIRSLAPLAKANHKFYRLRSKGQGELISQCNQFRHNSLFCRLSTAHIQLPSLTAQLPSLSWRNEILPFTLVGVQAWLGSWYHGHLRGTGPNYTLHNLEHGWDPSIVWHSGRKQILHSKDIA